MSWLSDIESFYRQRSAIEKEYATKLQSLCSESFKKKAKISSLVSVGDEPVVTPGSLENSTLTVWNEILNQTELIAKDKMNFSSTLDVQIAESVARFQRIANVLQKKYNDLNGLVTKERDSSYADLKKAKQSYDSTCEDMEHVRVKSEKSSKSDKMNKKLSEKEYKMNVSKNAYIIKINQTNRLKDKYYYQDLPEILDGLQDINEFKTNELNKIWQNAVILEKDVNNSVNGHLDRANSFVEKNSFQLDTIMFIKHNIEPWKEPQDFYYEPSPIWHDDDQVIVKPDELNDLKKQLAVANKLYLENDSACEKLQEKISEINSLKISMKNNKNVDTKNKKSVSYYVDESIQSLKVFIVNDNKRVAAEVAMQTIQSSAGDNDLTLTEPLEKKKKSRLGFLKKSSSHHSSSNNLSGAGVATGNGKLSRASTTHSKGIGSLVGSRLRSTSVTSQATSTVTVNEGVAVYPYQSAADDEVSVGANEKFEVVETDDGSGWTKVQKTNGEAGLVPTSYITINQVEKPISGTASTSDNSVKKIPPKVLPKRGAKKLPQARILYDYEADGSDELTVKADETVAVLEEDDGSGWTLGELKGMKGLFPTSYAEFL